MNNATCVCTVSHKENKLIAEWPNRFYLPNYDPHVLVDITRDNSASGGFQYTENDIRKNLNVSHGVSPRHYWNSFGNRNIIWFYAHYRMLNFYLSNPNYDFYWFFDDDVAMNDWNKFLSSTDKDDSDFISYFIFKKPGVKSQPNIPEMDNRTTSKHMWFERFPGHTDALPSGTTELFGSFFPTTRYSNNAMKTLLDVHSKGFIGYGEGFVPTVLNLHGMKLNTLITPNNTSNLYNVNEIRVLHKNIFVDWNWI